MLEMNERSGTAAGSSTNVSFLSINIKLRNEDTSIRTIDSIVNVDYCGRHTGQCAQNQMSELASVSCWFKLSDPYVDITSTLGFPTENCLGNLDSASQFT